VKRLIITGDDFGLAIPVNEAIEVAHVSGILSTTSLMVGASAAADAVEKAKRLPTLKVGLHLVLVKGRPVLPPDSIPGLVNEHGEFHENLVAAGFRFFFLPNIRKQLEAEIRGQFDAFQKTGLPLDHVNAHNHMHVHPTILNLILKVGRDFGVNAIRVPHEPSLPAWHASRKGFVGKMTNALGLAPWMWFMKVRLRHAGMKANDFIFGRSDTGAMDEATVLRLLERVPRGVTEMYFHPATRRCPEIDEPMPTYRHEWELAALVSPKVRAVMEQLNIQTIGFQDI
jgi:hopanoid biosynthesis associated protein HpnK